LTSTINTGATTITPDLVLSYEATRAGRNILHTIIGRTDPDVTFAPAGLRSGTLELFFLTRLDAFAAGNLHALPNKFVLADTTHPQIGMTYVLDGSIGYKLDIPSQRWVVTIDFHEVF